MMNSTVQTSEEAPKGRKKLSDEAIRAKKFARTLKQVKRTVLEVQLLLLDGVETDAQLHAAGALLTQSEYGDVITERAIVKFCGFTRCGIALTTENTRKGRYRISLSAKKVYDLQEASQFCCSDCLLASREFRNKLPPERDALTSQETATETLKLVRGSQYPRPRLPRTRPPKDSRASTRDALKDIKPGETAAHSNIKPNSADFGDAHKEGNDKDCDLATSTSNPKSWNPQGEASDNLASSTRENLYCVKSGKEIMHPGEVKTSGLNSSNPGLRSVNDEHGGNATSSCNFDFTSTVMTSSVKGDHGDIPSSSFDPTATNTRISLPQTLAHSKGKSAPVEIKEKAGRQSLERAHDGNVLPIFDYSGPSDAIEGYVPVKSRSLLASGAEQPVDATVSSNQAGEVGEEFASTSGGKQGPTRVGNKFEWTEALKEASEPLQLGSGTGRRPSNGGCKEWAGLVSVDAVASSVNAYLDIVEEHDIGCPSSSSSNAIITGEDKESANLKPALKKQLGRQNYGLNVSWLDQNVDQVDSLIEERSTNEKAAPVSKKVASTKKKVKSSRVKPALTDVNACISSTSTLKEPLLHLVKAVESDIISVNRTESSKKDVEEQDFNKTAEFNLETVRALRLASAEAISTALTKAATAAAAGEIDCIDAVASAGISILSPSNNSTSATSASAGKGKEGNIDMSEDGEEGELRDNELYERALRASGGEPRWPRTRTIDNDEDEDGDGDGDGDEDDNEYGDEGFEGAHEVGFDPAPKGFKAEVSMFGTMYMALDRWISAATVAHIYGKEPYEQDMFLSVDGREYGWQVVIGDGVSAEILRTFSLCLSRAIPEVVRVLRLPVPMSTLEQALGRLVKTLSFVDPLPPFGTKHWRMVAVLLLDALSVRKLPLLGAHLSNNRAVFRKVLESTGTSEAEYDTFRDLVLPLGRLPSFSMLSGG